MPAHHVLDPSPETVHWGYFDATIPARLTVDSGDTVTVNTVSGGRVEVADLSIIRPDHRETRERSSMSLSGHGVPSQVRPPAPQRPP